MPPYHNHTRDNHTSLLLPVSIIVVGFLLIMGMLARSFAEPSLAQDGLPQDQAATAAYAAQQKQTIQTLNTEEAEAYILEQTRTAEALIATDEPSPTATEEPTEERGGGGGGGGGGSNPSSTPSPEPSDTPQPAEAPTATNTNTVLPATTVPAETSTPTGTPTETPQSNFFVCFPNDVTVIEGIGPANTELVLYFADRPVGGGLTTANGEYAIPLVVGSERSGSYLVQVKTRIRRQIVRELICEVPTPTPGLQP